MKRYLSTLIVIAVPIFAVSVITILAFNVTGYAWGNRMGWINFGVGVQTRKNDYLYERTITVSSTLVAPSGTSLTNFPMLISGTYSYLAASSSGGTLQNTNGYDVIFSSDPAGNNKLNYEIETYSSTTGAVNLWVQVPTFSSSTNKVYMFYDNADIQTSQQNASSVWSNSYKGVWHFPNGTALGTNDSTGNNTATNNGATAISGEVDGAAAFHPSSSQYINIGTGTAVTNLSEVSSTFSFWINPATSSAQAILAKNDDNTVGAGWWIQLLNDYTGYLNVGYVIEYTSSNIYTYASSTIPVGSWTKIDVVGDPQVAGNEKYYINGKLVPTVVAGAGAVGSQLSDASDTLYLGFPEPTGGAYGATTYANSDLDEVELANVARSPDWIATEYNNQSNPSAFYSIGAPTTPQSFSADYVYERTITASSSLVAPSGTTLTNFPMLISGTYSYLAASSSGGTLQNANGYDVMFASDSGGGHVLNYEIESYSSTTGGVNYWVQVPSFSSSNNKVYMFYDNPYVTKSQQNAAGTWDSYYTGVWHLANGTTLNPNDSTVHANNGSLINGPTATNGEIDGAGAFVGSSSQYIATNQLLSNFISPSSTTFEAWVMPSGSAPIKSTIYQGAGIIGDEDAYTGLLWDNLSGSSDEFWAYNDDGALEDVGTTYTPGQFIDLVQVHSGGVLSLYANGLLVGTTTSGNTTDLNWNLATSPSASRNSFSSTNRITPSAARRKA